MTQEVQQIKNYRCEACGNRTRFDITTTRRQREFHHFDLAGRSEIEDSELISERIEEVACRWCGHGRDVEQG